MQLSANNPQLELLQKALITDSRGQHKDRVSQYSSINSFEEAIITTKRKSPKTAEKSYSYDDYEDVDDDITDKY